MIKKLRGNPIKEKKKFISKAVIKLSLFNFEAATFCNACAKLLHQIIIYPNASTLRVSQPAIKAPVIRSAEDFINDALGVFPRAIKSIIIVASTLHLLNVKNIGMLTSFTENNPNSTWNI